MTVKQIIDGDREYIEVTDDAGNTERFLKRYRPFHLRDTDRVYSHHFLNAAEEQAYWDSRVS
jgi:hypothetical protein